MTMYRVFVGFDPAEMRACTIARFSARAHSTVSLDVRNLSMVEFQARGHYYRPTEKRDVGYWDVISEAPMSTEHAIARFLVPFVCKYEGWALFTDGDVLVRGDIGDLFALADPRYAVQVVKHQHAPTETAKMTGHVQTQYARKNWSSVLLFNCGHPANRALTVGLVNTLPGRDLHRFCWLQDDQIGSLPERWNWLVGHSNQAIDPALVHFTSGLPDMAGYEHVDYADEWYAVARSCGYRLTRPPKPERVAV